MKKILLLATGGTIACVPSEDGLVPGLSGARLLELVPQAAQRYEIACEQILNSDSSNITPKHWQIIVRAIEKSYDAYDGIVITHGTDTLAYTAAALSQMLCNCQKPIILTGAQLPIEATGSDAPKNLSDALMLAASDFMGVGIVFGGEIIHGACAKKLYTESFDAFASINRPRLGKVSEEKIFWTSTEHRGGAYGTGNFFVQTLLEEKIALVKIFPGMSPEVLDFYLEKNYRGIILEGFGAGGVPNGENNWLPYLERLLRAGIKIICATQCLYEGVCLEKYPIGIFAQRLGAASAENYTVEYLTVKLMLELAKKKE